MPVRLKRSELMKLRRLGWTFDPDDEEAPRPNGPPDDSILKIGERTHVLIAQVNTTLVSLGRTR